MLFLSLGPIEFERINEHESNMIGTLMGDGWNGSARLGLGGFLGVARFGVQTVVVQKNIDRKRVV